MSRIFLLLLLLCLGCGGTHDQITAPGETGPVELPAAQMDPAQPRGASSAGRRYTAEELRAAAPKGRPRAGEAPRQARREDFQAPYYPGATVDVSVVDKRPDADGIPVQVAFVRLLTEDSVEQVADYYRDLIPGAEEQTVEAGGKEIVMLRAPSGSRGLKKDVVILRSENGTTVIQQFSSPLLRDKAKP